MAEMKHWGRVVIPAGESRTASYESGDWKDLATLRFFDLTPVVGMGTYEATTAFQAIHNPQRRQRR